MIGQTGASPSRGLFVVWRDYQRRAEVLAEILGSDAMFLPHQFTRRYLRPLDYILKFLRTRERIVKLRPSFVVVQAPPAFVALPALLMRVPYVVDAHNALVQGMWRRIPFTTAFLRNALAVLAHNDEIAVHAREAFPDATILTLRDPLEAFDLGSPISRSDRRVMPIVSFGGDEPVDLLMDVIEECPDLRFVITANPHKLDAMRRKRLIALPNVELTGFLPTTRYQLELASAGAAIVLTTREATQPSGACEALSSDTPLVLSRTSLTEAMFGSWAYLVDHDVGEIVRSLRLALATVRSLRAEREQWTSAFAAELVRVQQVLSRLPSKGSS